MLETDEVDIDYFTPAGSTSLASIFGKSSVIDESKENPSLKYVPPPPPEKSKSEELKPTQWILTCAIHGFEWINSEYINRGKLGLAVLKVVKTNSHSIILYDSNKRTVSYVAVSPKLSIHVRDDTTLSYYDNAQKYWIIKTSEDDINKILQLLNDLQATIVPKSVEETVREQSGSNKLNNKDHVVIEDLKQEEEHDTDTDCYLNQKTKDSILKRMANMGHSVLPPPGIAQGHTSDSSSDSNENNSKKKSIQLKSPKVAPKQYTNLSTHKSEINMACHSKTSTHGIQMDMQTIAPVKKNTLTYGGDMNVFISEQKISNSELRINVNRVSDKLDVILERLNGVISIDKNNSFSNFQNDIVQKLIREYESKIKYYEYIMNSKGIDFHTRTQNIEKVSDSCEENVVNMDKITGLEKECKEKDNIIRELEKKIRLLNENSIKTSDENQKQIDSLMIKIETLNENINRNNENIDSDKKISSFIGTVKKEGSDIVNKVKNIMNDTFEAISVNFDDEEDYSGEKVKAVVAKVIKKTTIQALQEL